MKPSTEFPHPKPSLAYIVGPAKGKNAPNSERETVRAAMPDAAKVGNESMVYVWMGMKMPIMPKPKGIRPMMGTIQWTLLSAIQPYQKKVMGMKNAKNMQAGRRISGSKTPLLALVIRTTVASEICAFNTCQRFPERETLGDSVRSSRSHPAYCVIAAERGTDLRNNCQTRHESNTQSNVGQSTDVWRPMICINENVGDGGEEEVQKTICNRHIKRQ